MCDISSSPLQYCWNPGGRRKRVKKGKTIHPSYLLCFLLHHHRHGMPERERDSSGCNIIASDYTGRSLSLFFFLFPLSSTLVNTLHSYCQDRWEVCERSLSLLINYRARADLNFARRNLQGNVIWQNAQWRTKGMRNRRSASSNDRRIKEKRNSINFLKIYIQKIYKQESVIEKNTLLSLFWKLILEIDTGNWY